MASKTNAQQRQATSKQTAAKPVDPHADAAAKVLRRFRVVFNAVKTHFRAVERTAGVSGAQVWAMSVVHERPGIGVSELARAMDIHQSTASNLLRGLTELGMVVSSREAEDRRSVQLYVTAKGQKVLAKVPGPFAGLLPDALTRLDDATLARLDRDLSKLVKQLGADARGATVLMGQRET